MILLDLKLSNDAVIFTSISGRGARKDIDLYSVISNLYGLEVTLEEDYSPLFNFKDNPQMDRVDEESLSYQRLMYSFYWESRSTLESVITSMNVGRELGHRTPRQSVEAHYQSISEERGERFFQSALLKALLDSDFPEKCAEMPAYRKRPARLHY